MLNNTRWERFAWALEDGKAVTAAYVQAGFKDTPASRVGASRLSRNPVIVERIVEIRAERDAVRAEGQRLASEKTGLTKTWVLEQLRSIAVQGLLGALGKDGKRTGQHFSAANRALELIGKELGMFVDRTEWGKPGDFSKVEQDELESAVLAGLIASGVRPDVAKAMVRAAAEGGEDEARGELN